MRPAVSPNRRFGMLLLFLLLCLAVSGIGGAFTASSVDGWYQQLAKPAFTPPDGVFGPVWTLLYLAIAVAGWRLWLRLGWRQGRGPLALWGLQLLMNLYWSVIFFGMQAPGAALIWIILLLALIVGCIRVFAAIDRPAAWLFVPYALWVAFATALNAGIWYLN